MLLLPDTVIDALVSSGSVRISMARLLPARWSNTPTKPGEAELI
jgi:hypothetical protein